MKPLQVDNIFFSEKGKKLFLIRGFKFRFHKKLANGKERWCCTNKKCKSYVKCFEGSSKIIFGKLEHNHEKDKIVKLKRQIFNNTVKIKAVDDLCEPPRKLIREELRKSDGNISEWSNKELQNIGRNIYKARYSQHHLPKSISETYKSLKNLKLLTYKDENFLLVNDGAKNFVMFSCETNLKFLSSLETIYVDATFTPVPEFFSQLFTIHGVINDHYIPLVFCLLEKTNQVSYERALKMVVSQTEKMGETLRPKFVVADLEIAIHNAVKIVWPDSEVKTCQFHLKQNWWRKIQNLGLTKQYAEKNTDGSEFLKLTFGLSLLPAGEVEDGFAFDIMSDAPKAEKIQNFCDYLSDHFISAESTFPPTSWAEFSASFLRTTRACELFHSHFNAKFYKGRPNVVFFAFALLDIQTETYDKIKSSKVEKDKRSDTFQEEEELSSFMAEYSAKLSSRAELLSNVCFKMLPKKKL